MSKITGKVNYKEVLKGDVGYTFTPHVTTDSILYWTNNGNLPNPTPVNIKGKDGDMVQEEEIRKIKDKLIDYINVESLGITTNTEDCSILVNKFMNNNSNKTLYFPNKTFKFLNQIELKNGNNIVSHGKLIYKGTKSFILIQERLIKLEFNYIESNDIAIEVIGKKVLDYITIKGNIIKSLNTGVYLKSYQGGGLQYINIDIMAINLLPTTLNSKSYHLDTSNGGYIGENRIFNTKLSGHYGLYLDGGENNGITSLKTFNVTIEGRNDYGVLNGIYMYNTSWCTFINLRGQEPTINGKQIIIKGNSYGNTFLTDILYLKYLECNEISNIVVDNIFIGVLYNNDTEYSQISNGITKIRKNGLLSCSGEYANTCNLYLTKYEVGKIQLDDDYFNTFLLDPTKQLILNSAHFKDGLKVYVVIENGGTILDEKNNQILNPSSYNGHVVEISYINTKSSNPFNRWIVKSVN